MPSPAPVPAGVSCCLPSLLRNGPAICLAASAGNLGRLLPPVRPALLHPSSALVCPHLSIPAIHRLSKAVLCHRGHRSGSFPNRSAFQLVPCAPAGSRSTALPWLPRPGGRHRTLTSAFRVPGLAAAHPLPGPLLLPSWCSLQLSCPPEPPLPAHTKGPSCFSCSTVSCGPSAVVLVFVGSAVPTHSLWTL